MATLRIFLMTYNVGTKNPNEDLRILLKTQENPDFFVLGFQEVNSQPTEMVKDVFYDDPWTSACTEYLGFGYIKIKSIRLQGLLLLVFSLRKHFQHIRKVETEYTRTGFGGIWGNKGGVSVRFTIYGRSFCFVNAHLAAHDEYLEQRIKDYNTIVEDQKFHIPVQKNDGIFHTSTIFDHDFLFWIGDLNFRLSENCTKSSEEVQEIIKNDKWEELLNFDQLKQVMKNGEAFSTFFEGDVKFPPTFKFEEGTSDYNLKRKPSWCDRILHKNRVESGVSLKVQQLNYKSHPDYNHSDHKPVSSEFLVSISEGLLRSTFTDHLDTFFKFNPISSWTTNPLTNKAIITINGDLKKNDWIGLYKENFLSTDHYLTYEYANNCATLLPGDAEDPRRYEIAFSTTLDNYVGEKVCLVYFSEDDNKVTDILGISNVFIVSKSE